MLLCVKLISYLSQQLAKLENNKNYTTEAIALPSLVEAVATPWILYLRFRWWGTGSGQPGGLRVDRVRVAVRRDPRQPVPDPRVHRVHRPVQVSVYVHTPKPTQFPEICTVTR